MGEGRAIVLNFGETSGMKMRLENVFPDIYQIVVDREACVGDYLVIQGGGFM